MSIGLSKSLYCKAMNCPKFIWLHKNRRDLAADTVNRRAADNGNEVGDLAMGLFGEYTEVPFDIDKQKMVARTRELLEAGTKVITEASFLYEGCFCSVDILYRQEGGGFVLYEVKSATEAKSNFITDIVLQTWVLRQCGLNVTHARLVHVNKDYCKHGPVAIRELFKSRDFTAEADSQGGAIASQIREMERVAALPEEPMPYGDYLGGRCVAPYVCPFLPYCSRVLPKENIFALKSLEHFWQARLYGREDFLEDQNVPGICRHQFLDTERHVARPALQGLLDRIAYPAAILDFGIIWPAVPVFDGTSPYQKLPFQYSLEILAGPEAEPEHREFLTPPGQDPRQALAEALQRDLPKGATVLLYSEDKFAAQLVPEFINSCCPELASTLRGPIDLRTPFLEGHFYVRAMKGEAGLAAVAAALLPDQPLLPGEGEEPALADDGQACDCYTALLKGRPQAPGTEKSLLAYRRRKTAAMARLLALIYRASREA